MYKWAGQIEITDPGQKEFKAVKSIATNRLLYHSLPLNSQILGHLNNFR